MDQRWIGVKQGLEFAHTTAEDREHAGNVVACVGAGGEEDLDAGHEPLGVARVSLDDVVEGGAGTLGVPSGSAP